MNRSLRLLLLAAILALPLQAAVAFTFWNDVRHSARQPGDQFTVRVENPQGAGVSNELLFADDGVQAVMMSAVDDGPATLEATAPAPGSVARPYGFRLDQDGEVDLLPVRLAGGGFPAPSDLSLLAEDPVGDEIFGRINLDLTGCRIARDDSRLYAALSNAGGGFPVSSGLTFFSYLLGITDPAVADPETVFAMIQTVDVPGIVEPGLYQVNGTGLDDLVRIGDITVTEFAAQNTLVLSCELADLESNPVFQSWYDPADPRIGVAGFSQRITLTNGTEEADRTDGGVWHLRELALGPLSDDLPQLAGLTIAEPGQGGVVSVEYSDVGGHCPVVAELEIDGEIFPLRPESLDYDGPVTYVSDAALPPVDDGTWISITARFSDNGVDLVEVQEMVVGVADARAGLQLRAAPNPSAGATEFSFTLARHQAVELAIFDLAGRRVSTLVSGSLPAGRHGRSWDGRDDRGRPQPSGVYVYSLRTAEQATVQRLALVR
jgi:hypothetical protein